MERSASGTFEATPFPYSAALHTGYVLNVTYMDVGKGREQERKLFAGGRSKPKCLGQIQTYGAG